MKMQLLGIAVILSAIGFILINPSPDIFGNIGGLLIIVSGIIFSVTGYFSQDKK